MGHKNWINKTEPTHYRVRITVTKVDTKKPTSKYNMMNYLEEFETVLC